MRNELIPKGSKEQFTAGQGPGQHQATGGTVASSHYQPLQGPANNSAQDSDNIYVPVLPDVPNLPAVPSENVQSGKHNTDCKFFLKNFVPIVGSF